jgi:hypothetical protein
MGRLIPHDPEDDTEDVPVPVSYSDDEDLPYDPAAFGQWADEIDRFSLDGCVTKRGERELYMFEGQSFWVHPVIPATLTNAWISMAWAKEGNMGRFGDSFAPLCEGLSRCVVGWDIMDPVTGEPYDQPWRNPDAIRELPTEALYYIVQTVAMGETPADRPNGSTLRRGGSGTRRSSGQKTRNSSTAPRRR